MKKSILISVFCGIVLLGAVYFAKKSEPGPVVPDWSRGSADPKVTLVEYADFQCPACKAYQPVLAQLANTFADDLVIVFRHFPLMQIHPNALSSSMAAEAAGAQGLFWEMHDSLYEHQSEWSEESDPTEMYVQYAGALNMDTDRFRADMSSSTLKTHVLANMRQGEAEEVSGTPTFFLNGKKIQNPGAYEGFAELIRQELGKNPSSGVTSDDTATTTVHEHADFLVSLNGQTYDFSQPRYQSDETKARDTHIHLHDGNGRVVHMHRSGVTLQSFFKTLGITLGKNCLKLDTGTEYCNSADTTLKLYVNGQESDQITSYVLKDEDKILVSYGPKDDSTIPDQLKAISDDACLYSETCPLRGKPPKEECVGGLGTTCE